MLEPGMRIWRSIARSTVIPLLLGNGVCIVAIYAMDLSPDVSDWAIWILIMWTWSALVGYVVHQLMPSARQKPPDRRDEHYQAVISQVTLRLPRPRNRPLRREIEASHEEQI